MRDDWGRVRGLYIYLELSARKFHFLVHGPIRGFFFFFFFSNVQPNSKTLFPASVATNGNDGID